MTTERESGWYWVKFHREPDKWLVARWDAAQGWWITEATMELPHGVVSGDGRWSVIGPRILMPDEAEIDMQMQLAQRRRDHQEQRARIANAIEKGARRFGHGEVEV